MSPLLSSPAHAATRVPWPNTTYAYFAQNEDLREVLSKFGTNFGVRVDISPRLRAAKVDGRITTQTPTAFLDRLAAAYGFTWFYYTGVLYITSNEETKSRTFKIDPRQSASLRGSLDRLGILDDRFGLHVATESGTVFASGPPRYIELVARTARALRPEAPAEFDIRVYRLRYARSDDRTFTYRNKEIVVPGVATILGNLVGSVPGVLGFAGTQNISRPTSLPSALGAAQYPTGGPSAASSGRAGGMAPSGPGAAPGPQGPLPVTPYVPPNLAQQAQAYSGGQFQPQIQADTRLNAVIVKDLREHMPIYDRLISYLDVPVALVEINAAIIDVSTNRLDELGVRWQGKKGEFLGGFGDVETAQPDDQTVIFGIGSPSDTLSTILTSSASHFLARISALESDGGARIQSRPSVLTANNLPAVLDVSETFYVRVSGENVANLFPVQFGTTLQVTPHIIITDSGQQTVQLSIDIETGNALRDQTVDDIPTVERSTLSTVAQIRENESLLVGGHVIEDEERNVSKVPILGDIPVLGYLFKVESESMQRVERLFLITPKIVRVSDL